nr:MAG TPA: hypothetical protein [Caudoviricetes sp.]
MRVTSAEILKKVTMFQDSDVALVYILAAHVATWEKERGSTAEDLVKYLEEHYVKH